MRFCMCHYRMKYEHQIQSTNLCNVLIKLKHSHACKPPRKQIPCNLNLIMDFYSHRHVQGHIANKKLGRIIISIIKYEQIQSNFECTLHQRHASTNCLRLNRSHQSNYLAISFAGDCQHQLYRIYIFCWRSVVHVQ